MKTEEINSIYDQLNETSVQIEPRSIPNPRYISEKIGECHLCIEKVEKFYNRANKEFSAYQNALNNAVSFFEISRDDLISNDSDISALPSAKDRESMANTRLKAQIQEINGYKQACQSLEILVKTINMKLRTLTRINGDIRVQMKLMESQIRLGDGGIDDKSSKNLMDELEKTALGKDIWEGAKTTSEETTLLDPSKPIDFKDLDPMALLEKTVDNIASSIKSTDITDGPERLEVSNAYKPDPKFTEVPPEVIPEQKTQVPSNGEINFNDLFSSVETKSAQPSEVAKVVQPEVTEETPDYTGYLPEDDILELSPSESEIEEEPESKIDLNKVLDFGPKTETQSQTVGGTPEKQNTINVIEPQKVQPVVEQNNQNDLFSALLSQFK